MPKKRADGRLARTFRYEGKKYFVYGHSPEELNEKETAKRAELKAGTEKRENPTLRQYYEYFTDVRRRTVRESTIRAQRFQFLAVADIAIDDNGKKLGDCKIKEITPKDVQRVQIVLADSERTTETVNNIMAHLKHVFNSAVRDETIIKSPCKFKNLKRTEKPARETIHRALTKDEQDKFFKVAKERNSYYYNIFALMINTGMRVGEVTALRISDIDEKYIHVRRTVTRKENNLYVVGDFPKTDSSRRGIPSNPDVKEIILNQRKQNMMLFGKQELETLFPSVEGRILRDYSVDREIERICKQAEIERFSSHAFRATFTTRYLEKYPESYKECSEILGHKDVIITLNTYAHSIEDRKRATMENFSVKLG